MGCLKCGKETGISSVFCDDCLCKMAAYPIKPDAAIQLPHRVAAPEDKKPARKKKQRSTAELLRRSRKRVLCLSVTVFLLLIGLLISLSLLVHTLDTLEEVQNQGKNYTTVT
jgi:hypothetical protein